MTILFMSGGLASAEQASLRARLHAVATAEAALDHAERTALPADIVAAARAHVRACERAWGGAAMQTVRCRLRLGDALLSSEDSAEAIAVLADAIDKLSSPGVEAERARAQSGVGKALLQLSRHPEAEVALNAALSAQEPRLGDAHVDTFRTLVRLASLRVFQVELDGAGRFLARAEAAAARVEIPPEDRAILLAIQGRLAHRSGKLEEAEGFLRQSLAAMDVIYRPLDPRRGFALSTLTLVLGSTQLDEAEAVARLDLEIAESAYPPLDPRVGTSLNNLAVVMMNAGRYEEAEPLLRRAAIVAEADGGPRSLLLATRLHNQALALQALNREREAEALLRRSLDIEAQSPRPNLVNLSRSQLGIARLRWKAGDFAAAESLAQQAMAHRRSALGDEHSLTVDSLVELGLIQLKAGYPRRAEATLRAAVLHAEKVHGGQSYRFNFARSLLGGALLAQNRAEEAWEQTRAAMLGLSGVSRVEGLRNGLTGLDEALEYMFSVAAKRPPRNDDDRDAVFGTMQLASRSFAGVAAARTAARMAQASPELAALDGRVRAVGVRVSDLQRESAQAYGRGDAAAVREAGAALAAQRGALAVAERELLDASPLFADLAGRLSVRVPDINGADGVLQRREAMLLTVQTHARLHLMLITKDGVRFESAGLPQEETAAIAARIRAGLRLEGALSSSDLPEFDLAAAHELYRRIIDPFRRDLARIETLYVIPDGPLASIPLSLLAAVPAPQDADSFERYRRTRYLSDELALATLPSPAAFVAARRHARASQRLEPLLAFADPALAGTEDVRTLTHWASLRNGVRAPTASMRNAASVCQLRPLPETRREALALAEQLGARPGDLLFGRAASERTLFELNASGALAQRRIVLFATHGLVAGELAGVTEPALVLTPNDCAATSESDDGVLTASEIATLTFDADWVILSGCNTAAPGQTGAAPLSGLARAFLYAGARRLLVSHWSVDSDAAADLTAALFNPRNGSLAPAAALREAMRAVRESGGAKSYRSHPAFWAPFVLVGDGR